MSESERMMLGALMFFIGLYLGYLHTRIRRIERERDNRVKFRREYQP